MDHILRLESEIRKAQSNKEIVVAVFFDIEKKNYNMLWKVGLLIKLSKLGVGGRLNWVMDFLLGRTIEVRVGTDYLKVYQVENGTP